MSSRNSGAEEDKREKWAGNIISGKIFNEKYSNFLTPWMKFTRPITGVTNFRN
jgi:hypothetical protein